MKAMQPKNLKLGGRNQQTDESARHNMKEIMAHGRRCSAGMAMAFSAKIGGIARNGRKAAKEISGNGNKISVKIK